MGGTAEYYASSRSYYCCAGGAFFDFIFKITKEELYMRELEKIYDPKQSEDQIYKFWEDGGFSMPR